MIPRQSCIPLRARDVTLVLNRMKMYLRLRCLASQFVIPTEAQRRGGICCFPLPAEEYPVEVQDHLVTHLVGFERDHNIYWVLLCAIYFAYSAAILAE
jgi:hypothetical protein